MKYMQVIDGAENTEYAIYAVDDDVFFLIFPGNEQDIEFSEDLCERLDASGMHIVFERIWERKVNKKDARGIHGTLFFELSFKKEYYPDKKEKNLIGVAGTVADIKYSKYRSD